MIKRKLCSNSHRAYNTSTKWRRHHDGYRKSFHKQLSVVFKVMLCILHKEDVHELGCQAKHFRNFLIAIISLCRSVVRSPACSHSLVMYKLRRPPNVVPFFFLLLLCFSSCAILFLCSKLNARNQIRILTFDTHTGTGAGTSTTTGTTTDSPHSDSYNRIHFSHALTDLLMYLHTLLQMWNETKNSQIQLRIKRWYWFGS